MKFQNLKKFLDACDGYHIFYKVVKDIPIPTLPPKLEKEIKEVAFQKHKTFFVKKTPERIYPFKGIMSKAIDFLLLANNEVKTKALKVWKKEIKKAKKRRKEYLNFITEKIKPTLKSLFQTKFFDMFALRYSSLTDSLPIPDDDVDLLIFQDEEKWSEGLELKVLEKIGKICERICFYYSKKGKIKLGKVSVYSLRVKRPKVKIVEFYIIDPRKELPFPKKKVAKYYRYIYEKSIPLLGKKEYERWKKKIRHFV
jgi:hypothetical protein